MGGKFMHFKTKNGADAYPNFQDSALEIFSKAGSIRDKSKKGQKPAFYGDDYLNNLVDIWHLAFNQDQEQAMKLLFWLRDPRGGAGNRQLFRDIYKSLAIAGGVPEAWAKANISLIAEHGRFDDVSASLYYTPLQSVALEFLANNLTNRLCAKWVNRKDSLLRDHLKNNRPDLGVTSNKTFRKLLVRNTQVVETQMCSKNWSNIEYKSVPSVAGVRYVKAFTRNDPVRYQSFINSKSTKMKTATAFPHEIWRMREAGADPAVIQKFFDSLKEKWILDKNILCMVDTSGSMDWTYVSGKIKCIHVASALGFYVSEMLHGPFHRRFLTFSSSPSLYNWGQHGSITKAMDSVLNVPWGGSTNIQAAFNLVHDTYGSYNIPEEHQLDLIIVLSDMQFDCGVDKSANTSEQSLVEKSTARFQESGYKVPGLVYWSLTGYENQPSHSPSSVGLISGFSPSVLKNVLTNLVQDERGQISVNTYEVLTEALSKYPVVDPYKQ